MMDFVCSKSDCQFCLCMARNFILCTCILAVNIIEVTDLKNVCTKVS